MVNIQSITKLGLAILLTTCAISIARGEKIARKKPLKICILAGQSNMQGKGTIKHLQQMVDEDPKAYGDLKRNREWVERDDVWIDYRSDTGHRQGKLTVGYGSPEDRIGPELGFGITVGDALEEPVLIIKYAVGGRAIGLEFRPPSSGPIDPCTIPTKLTEQIAAGDQHPGSEYRKMMAHIKSVMGNLKASVPDYDDGPFELAGFVWFQGWNDQYNGFEKYYQQNMANFIRDVRRELKAPNLPFVIGGMGQGGDHPMYKSALIRKAQAATAEMPEFKDNHVRCVPTAPYWREGEQGDGGYHYNGNAETFLLIGKAFAKAILEMQPSEPGNAEARLGLTSKKLEAIRFDPVAQQIEGWTVPVLPSRHTAREDAGFLSHPQTDRMALSSGIHRFYPSLGSPGLFRHQGLLPSCLMWMMPTWPGSNGGHSSFSAPSRLTIGARGRMDAQTPRR